MIEIKSEYNQDVHCYSCYTLKKLNWQSSEVKYLWNGTSHGIVMPSHHTPERIAERVTEGYCQDCYIYYTTTPDYFKPIDFSLI